MHLKRSSAKWWPFCLGLNVLTQTVKADNRGYVSVPKRTRNNFLTIERLFWLECYQNSESFGCPSRAPHSTCSYPGGICMLSVTWRDPMAKVSLCMSVLLYTWSGLSFSRLSGNKAARNGKICCGWCLFNLIASSITCFRKSINYPVSKNAFLNDIGIG